MLNTLHFGNISEALYLSHFTQLIISTLKLKTFSLFKVEKLQVRLDRSYAEKDKIEEIYAKKL